MRQFMDYVHSAFYEATGWNRDNSYAALNSTSEGKKNRSELLCEVRLSCANFMLLSEQHC